MNLPAYGTFAIGGDLTVDRIGFGAMRLARNGTGDAAARDPDTAQALLRRAVELGVDHIDTADFYRSPDGTVRANDLIREALFPYPAGLVIATKVGPVFGEAGPTQGGAADLRAAVEARVRRGVLVRAGGVEQVLDRGDRRDGLRFAKVRLVDVAEAEVGRRADRLRAVRPTRQRPG
jgi:hypothetical protein